MRERHYFLTFFLLKITNIKMRGFFATPFLSLLFLNNAPFSNHVHLFEKQLICIIINDILSIVDLPVFKV